MDFLALCRSGLIWVGTDNGNVQLTRDGGKSWTRLNDNLPDAPLYKVTRVEASYHDPGVAYVTISGGRHDRRDLEPYVYKTTDYGVTFQLIVDGLPDDEPVLATLIYHDKDGSERHFDYQLKERC